MCCVCVCVCVCSMEGFIFLVQFCQYRNYARCQPQVALLFIFYSPTLLSFKGNCVRTLFPDFLSRILWKLQKTLQNAGFFSISQNFSSCHKPEEKLEKQHFLTVEQ